MGFPPGRARGQPSSPSSEQQERPGHRHDPTAGLFVPIELLFNESPDGGCAVTYVVPSSLIAIDDNAPLLAAAKRLDDKLEALMVSALG